MPGRATISVSGHYLDRLYGELRRSIGRLATSDGRKKSYGAETFNPAILRKIVLQDVHALMSEYVPAGFRQRDRGRSACHLDSIRVIVSGPQCMTTRAQPRRACRQRS